MALLSENGMYIRILPDGQSYEIYATKGKRDKVKIAPTYEEVLAKYDELFKTKIPTEEALYYLTEEQIKKQFPLWKEWKNERERYIYAYQQKHGWNEYPLMAQYIPNVCDSVPDIIQSGSISALPNEIIESYQKAKEGLYWGQTEDV